MTRKVLNQEQMGYYSMCVNSKCLTGKSVSPPLSEFSGSAPAQSMVFQTHFIFP